MARPKKRKFTKIVREEMEAQALTWRALCDKADISQQTLKKSLDNNGEGLQVRTLERICKAVGVSPAELWA